VRLTVLEPHRARPEYLELKAKLERSEGRGD